MLINVNPKVLVWAREERFGEMPVKEVADKLGVEESSITKWETNGEGMPFDVLESIAKAYKRQTATFFLNNVPPKAKKIKDGRNLAVGGGKFSPDVLLAIRRTERYLQITQEVNSVSYWNNQYEWVKNLNGNKDDIEKDILSLRELLDSPQDGKINQARNDAAFRFWRTKIENKLGIFVFQFPMPEKELDGFSYAFESFPYAIVINNQKTPVRKIFTLFHELAHISRHNPSLCKTDTPSSDEQIGVEFECNNFAGKFLVPSQSVRKTNSVDEIFDLARLFNVSGEVYLRRLFEEKKVGRDNFFELLSEVREKSNSFPRRKEKGGAPSMIIQSKSTRGNKFYNLVTNAAVTNQISFSVASDLLGLKVGNIGR